MKKAFTLIELLAVVIVLGIVVLIATPIVLNVIEDSRRSANLTQAYLLLDGAQTLYSTRQVTEENLEIFDGEDDVYHLIEANDEKPTYGNVKITRQGAIDFAVYIDDACYKKGLEETKISIIDVADFKECVGADANIPQVEEFEFISITTSTTETDTSKNYSVTIKLGDFVESPSTSKYIINRSGVQIPVDSSEWDDATTFKSGTEIIGFSGDELHAGIFYVHVLVNVRTESGLTYHSYTSGNSVHVKIDEPTRTARLDEQINLVEDTNTPILSPTVPVKLDVVQMWFLEYESIPTLIRTFEALKRAGYEGIIIPDVTNYYTKNNEVLVSNLFYKTSNNQYIDEDTQNYENQISKVIEAATAVGLDFYLGTGTTGEWWEFDKISNVQWRTNVANYTISVIDELYSMYNSNPNFAGWIWTQEIYTTDTGMEQYWIPYMQTVINHLNNMADRKPVMISPAISSYDAATVEEITSQWEKIFNQVDFRAGDIVNFQDGFGVVEHEVNHIWEVHAALKELVQSENGLKYYLNVYNTDPYDEGVSSTTDRYFNQLSLAKYLAIDGLTSFSYTNYYNPLHEIRPGEFVDGSYDKKYRELVGLDTSNDEEIYSIPAPTGGYVYKDSNGDEAPIPAGFTISAVNGETIIRNGLVIKDTHGNEFVWVPVSHGIVSNDHNYLFYELDYTGYARRFTNGYVPTNYATISLPVANEYDQIKKYYGFYVARYESSFYTNGTISAAQSKPSTNVNVNVYPNSSASSSQTGNLNFNVGVLDAITLSENMATAYNYDTSIKTTLITGAQWDTVISWLNNADYNYWDGTSWGNYHNSVGEATNGNYESLKIKNTGSNEAWQAKNIYDIAGNLREWTNEKTGSNYLLRDTGGALAGAISGPDYSAPTPSYAVADWGFRAVLFID